MPLEGRRLGKVISLEKHSLYTGIGVTMSTKLERISCMSWNDPTLVFTSIYHLINKELLLQCHEEMDGNKAVGIDGVTKDVYGKHLDANLDELVIRLKNKGYHPKPARRVEIPKDNGKTRPLNIYCYEDKLVQDALRRVLEAVYEPCFCDEMMGFRPGRGCHDAIRRLNVMLEREKTSFVLDADIKGFFDHLDHEHIIRLVGQKIKDPNILRLVRTMLRSGVMIGFNYEETNEGSGQGSVCSPIIANIYMHYVLVLWFRRAQMNLHGYSGLVVYADDFIVCFQYKTDAVEFLRCLKLRLNRFGLQLEPEKTRLIEFGRFAKANRKKRGAGKPETFTFLGFTHYCSSSRNGKFRVKRKTSRKKFAKKCKELSAKLKAMRNWDLALIFRRVNQILTGYYHYYGITDNFYSLSALRNRVIKLLFYWLNRRSQRKSYSWEGFKKLLKAYPVVRPKIYVSVYNK